ncbi:uncharacterized protein PODANS_1_23035 [Podospora anserina S mat+]|uniref:Podospora anserina S mat+ genomic DNA chromosome 1, supercontig 6 n=1 Tax=Podospora anserina (strain S / ATCC MYA-4624 / DSM 980 / FGSC 10383) TaxID=515849 RepID=B2ASC2_PODAN|nr:uncharacterized protein PODANS_1_23035 [Podospora anserina S mat+]CAP67295.1 unnamed protein product [Podospora anserina S mat+]CDP24706.1 Putative protein of unknown function [Podospora anserina S mat+]
MKGVIPFPLGLTLGTDVCMIPRVYSLITTNQGTPIIPTLARPFNVINNVDRFTKKLLTQNERERLEELPVYLNAVKVMSFRDGVGPVKHKNLLGRQRSERRGEIWKLAEWLAGRWAAKEAVIKAHAFRAGTSAGKVTFGGVEIMVEGEENLGRRVEETAEEEGEGAGGRVQRKDKGDYILENIDGLGPRAEFGRVTGPPVAVILGDEEVGVKGQVALLSISHDGDYATAICLGFKPDAFNGNRNGNAKVEGKKKAR